VAVNGSGTAVDLIAITEVLALDPDASFENQAGGGLKLRADEGTLAKKSVRSGSFWMDGYDDDGLVVSDRLDDGCALFLLRGGRGCCHYLIRGHCQCETQRSL